MWRMLGEQTFVQICRRAVIIVRPLAARIKWKELYCRSCSDSEENDIATVTTSQRGNQQKKCQCIHTKCAVISLCQHKDIMTTASLPTDQQDDALNADKLLRPHWQLTQPGGSPYGHGATWWQVTSDASDKHNGMVKQILHKWFTTRYNI